MKRSILFMLALAAACFGVAVGTNLIEFSSDQTDRRAVILSVGAVVGLAALGFGSSEDDSESEATTDGRALASRRLQPRIDPETLPATPGSLLKRRAEAESAHEQAASGQLDVELVDSPNDAAASPIIEIGEEITSEAAPFIESTATEDVDESTVVRAFDVPADHSDDAADASAPPEVLVPVAAAETDVSLDEELVELIDEEQMLEINDLVAAALASNDDQRSVVAINDDLEPLKRLELRLADYDDADLARVVKESEAVVIAEMVRSGQLTSEGALTEQDIASMVFLAYTSEEMLRELRLRKSLDMALPLADIEADVPVEKSR